MIFIQLAATARYRALPRLAPAPRGHYAYYVKILAPKSGVETHIVGGC